MFLGLYLHPRLVVGIDIDPHLITKAKGHLRHRYSLLKTYPIKDESIDWDYFPDSFPSLFGNVPFILHHNDAPENEHDELANTESQLKENKRLLFPHNIEFHCGDVAATENMIHALGTFGVILWYEHVLFHFHVFLA